MKWIYRFSNHDSDFLKQISILGWSKDQLSKDGVQAWKDDTAKRIFFTLGDWAKIESDDIKITLQKCYPGFSIDWDFEVGGPGPGSWDKI